MAESVTVRPVSSRRDLKRFVDFQYEFYRGNEYWIPPLRRDAHRVLDPKKNAFFEHGRIQPFLASSGDGRVLGRIAGIVNGMHLEKYGDGNGFFGFFEVIEDYVVAQALLDAVRTWLLDQGLVGMRGPASPSLNDTAGLLVEGFDKEPFVLMPYNPPYYEPFLERYGFQRAMTMWAYYIHKKTVRLDKLRRGVDLVQRRYSSLKLRTIDMRRFEEEARTLRDIYNAAWHKNWGHVPMTEAEFAQLAKEMKQIIDPRLVLIVEDDGRSIGFLAGIPDINKLLRHVPDGRLLPFGLPKLLAYSKFGGLYEIRVPLMGVLPAYHGKGVDAILYKAIIEDGPKYGYDAAEMSWVLETNQAMKRAMESMGGLVDKQYALYELRFTS